LDTVAPRGCRAAAWNSGRTVAAAANGRTRARSVRVKTRILPCCEPGPVLSLIPAQVWRPDFTSSR